MDKIKVALFDVDGVLAIGKPFSHELELKYGITKEMTQPFFQGIFLECLTGKADLKQEVVHYLQQWGWQGSVDDFMNAWFQYEHEVNEPVLKIVRQLRERGVPCYLATNQEKYRTEYILNKMSFIQEFDGIFSSTHVGYTKPQAAFFNAIVKKLAAVKPQEIVFWDDNPGHVATARAAGIKAEVYHNFEEFSNQLALYFNLAQE